MYYIRSNQLIIVQLTTELDLINQTNSVSHTFLISIYFLV